MAENPNGVIYALADPRNPRLPRYIGKTKNSLRDRLEHHLSAVKQRPHYALHKWIAELRSFGLIPVIYVLESIFDQDISERETAWIKFFKPLGHVFNRSDGDGMLGMKHPLPREVYEKAARTKTGRPMSALQKARWIESGGRDKFREASKVAIKSSDGVFRFSSMTEAAKYLGVHQGSIVQAVGKHGKCSGYYWERDESPSASHVNPPPPDRRKIIKYKLSIDDRMEILRLCRETNLTQKDIAIRYDVHQSDVSRIANGKRQPKEMDLSCQQ